MCAILAAWVRVLIINFFTQVFIEGRTRLAFFVFVYKKLKTLSCVNFRDAKLAKTARACVKACRSGEADVQAQKKAHPEHSFVRI